MSLLAADNLCLAYGPKTILDGAGFMISPQDRVGVVGPNGTGKSTLFRILSGKQELDDGAVHIARGVSLGYLPQDVLEIGEAPLLESVLSAVPGKVHIEDRLRLAEEDIIHEQEPERQMRLAQRIADLHDQIDRFEAEYSRHKAESILAGLGFKTKDFDKSLSIFSGGWKTRAALAGLLFKKPDLLLLDEPTNHLDIPSLMWLDEFLKQVSSSIMLISHDRDFINRHAQRILSFEIEGLRAYTGNYDQYLVLREQELEVRRAARRNQEAQIRQAEQFIRRFRAKSTKARQVQSRVKKLEKMELVEVDHERASIEFRFPPCERTGRHPVKVENISQSFGPLDLYRNLNAAVERGDRVALIGENGAGKTTLLRIMSGELEPTAGEVKYGTNVELSYYAQHHLDKLNPNRSVLEEVWVVNPSLTQTRVRSICGAFLFSGEEVDKQVGVLSGGEMARVSLAQLLVKPGNLLLMDEPTNHLDLISSEALAETLDSFDGTLIFVSHNRAFIKRLATRIWDIQDGKLIDYPGSLDEYFYHRQNAVETDEPEEVKEAKSTANDSEAKVSFEQRKQINRQRKTLERRIEETQKKIADIEDRVARLDVDKAELEKALSDPSRYDDQGAFDKLLDQFTRKRDKLDELTARWEHLIEEGDKLSSELDELPSH